MLIEMSERIMKKLKAVFYARVSTDHSDQLHSLKAQQDYFYQYLDNHPEFELVNSYVDEGITGTSIKKRKSFQKMINDALHHHFDIILTKEVTRFARNTLDTLQMVRLLKENNVDRIDYLCWSHPDDDHTKGIDSIIRNFCTENTKINGYNRSRRR